MHKLAELGRNGVLVLCADSRIPRIRDILCRKQWFPSRLDAFHEVRGRIILATLRPMCPAAWRLMRLLKIKEKFVSSAAPWSMVGIALEMVTLRLRGTFIGTEELNHYRDDRICILTTGSQGEPMAGLSVWRTEATGRCKIHAGDTSLFPRRFREMNECR